MNSLWQDPIFCILLTLISYQCGVWISEKLGHPLWAPPFILSLILLVVVLAAVNVDYNHYKQSTQVLTMLLGLATVALAVPLYRCVEKLLEARNALLLTLVIGSVLGSASAVLLALAFSVSDSTVLAFSTRAVTTPITIGIANIIHAPAALAGAIVIVSGVIGASFADVLFKYIHSPIARGFALGLAAHGIGTAKAFQRSSVEGAFAALGMSLNGILTAFWLPSAVHLLMPYLS